MIARFCECITEYLANIDKAPDPLVKKEFYSTEINSAFDILFNSWLTSKDAKVTAMTKTARLWFYSSSLCKLFIVSIICILFIACLLFIYLFITSST